MPFPKDFIWGAAAASYQIEGATQTDGRGLCVWDNLCRQPGKIWNGQNADITCDHYHHYKQDVAIMAEIGLQAYRMSIAWPRVLPEGVGQINQQGLDFYDKLIDELLTNNITPWVTLFHWDYPYELYCKGGWLNRDSADWFAEYTRVIVDHFSDRVQHWMPQNEPQCFLGFGHHTGQQAPGIQLGFADVLRATHHALLAHGKAVQVIRNHAKTSPTVGCAPVGFTKMPYTDSPADIEAARLAMFDATEKTLLANAWITDPMVLGQYPEQGLKAYEKELPPVKDGDMQTICQPLDFYGANIYLADPIVAADNVKGFAAAPQPTNTTLQMFHGPVTPEALYWGPKYLYERYNLPVVITENGMPNCDWVQKDGQVHDPQRIDFLDRYLSEYRRAGDDGVDIRGYFQWSIMDNFEWSHGYKMRFGLVYVDFETGQRVIKDSGRWYGKMIETNGEILDQTA